MSELLNFSELFMEDCFVEAPSEFIPDIVTIQARQSTLGGFRPDVLALDASGRDCIVELQLRGLDRTHLYKCLEYRDLLHAQQPSERPRVILLCEELPEKYVPVLKTHDIELATIPRVEFLTKAARACPGSLAKHFALTARNQPSRTDRAPFERPDVFAPRDWSDHVSSAEVLIDLEKELARFDLDPEKFLKPYQHRIYWNLKGLTWRRSLDDIPEALYRPQYWNCDALKGSNYSTVSDALQAPPGFRGLRQPRISVRPYITSKGNLSVVWYPFDGLRQSEQSDFRYAPSESAPAYERPGNELLYVRDVTHLWLDNPAEVSVYRDESTMIVDEYLAALMWALYCELISNLKLFADVTETAKFEFDLYEDSDERFVDRFRKSLTRASKWRIYDVEAQARVEERKWIDGFEAEYGLTPLDLVAAWKRAGSKPRRSATSAHKYLAQEGIKMPPSTAKKVIYRLQDKHAWLFSERLK